MRVAVVGATGAVGSTILGVMRERAASLAVAFGVGALATIDYLPAIGLDVYPAGHGFNCDQRGSFLTSLISYGYRLDRRNDYLNPTRGFYISANVSVWGGAQ